MPGLARRARAVQVDQRRDFSGKRIFRGELRLVIIRGVADTTFEVDVHHRGVAGSVRRRQFAQRLLGPLGRLLGVVEVEVDAIEGARAAQRGETLVDRLTCGAELRVGGVPEGEDGKAHAFDAWRSIAHQRGVEVDGAARRIAFAPGGGEHDQVLGLRQHGKVGVGEVDDLGIEAMLLGELLGAHGQGFGVAAFAGIENGQRLARL